MVDVLIPAVGAFIIYYLGFRGGMIYRDKD